MNRMARLVLSAAVCMAAVACVESAGLAAGTAQKPRMVIVQKIIGIPWTDAMAKGVADGAEEFGIDATLTGPAAVDVAQQTKMLEDILAQGIDALGLVPLDEKVAAPILQKAKAAGVKIVTLEGPNQVGKDWNIDLIQSVKFGEEQMKSLAQAMGEEGDYIVFVGTLTTPLHNAWANAAIAYQKEHYPKMRLATDRFPGGDSIEGSQRTTLDAIKAYPRLKGVLAEGANGPIGAGNAIRQAGADGKIFVVGTCIPSQAQALISAGIIHEGFLWNPIDSGYAMVAVASDLLKGNKIADGMTIGQLGAAVVDEAKGTITFDKIMRFDKSNVQALADQGI
ncbi:substrate-binding domain-containing protein [Inquilinus sp. OTU3971]|uniref:substrate-binding domain-containing protein n=1 Tax=Inquilinus sp. OTU3971 TaxID=3043855 RepID=UPI00313B37A1